MTIFHCAKYILARIDQCGQWRQFGSAEIEGDDIAVTVSITGLPTLLMIRAHDARPRSLPNSSAARAAQS